MQPWVAAFIHFKREHWAVWIHGVEVKPEFARAVRKATVTIKFEVKKTVK